MQQSKKSVTARVPQDLYDKCNQHYENMTDAVIAGLELLCNQNCNTNVIASGEFKVQIEERDVKIKELQNLNNSLVKELENYNEPENKKILELQNIRVQDLQEQLRVKDQQQDARIADLKEQIQALNEQLKIKDEQLRTKDDQIEKVNEIMKGQVANIFNLTNIKLLPPENKKRWWEFWKN